MTINPVEEVWICGTIVNEYIVVPTITPPPVTSGNILILLNVDGNDFIGNSFESPSLLNREYSIFWNDVSRYLKMEDGEWEYSVPTDPLNGGFTVLIEGFSPLDQTFIVIFKSA